MSWAFIKGLVLFSFVLVSSGTSVSHSRTGKKGSSSACYCQTGVNALAGDIKVSQMRGRLAVTFLRALFTGQCKTRF